jgi:micrococcal nuclease
MKAVTFALLLCAGLIGATVAEMSAPAPDQQAGGPNLPALARVEHAADGDTMILATGETVRLIGVDTPEIHHPERPVEYFAAEAREFLERMATGREVKLVYGEEKQGKHGRLLAYAYLPDGTFLNAEIIKAGYGFAYTKYPFEFAADFVRYESEARQKRKGLWAGGDMAEFRWIKSQRQTPFEVYDLSNRKWAVEFQGMARICSSLEEVGAELDFLRNAAYGLSAKDLRAECISRGWHGIGEPVKEKTNE